jgi:putative aminopeptidase FrvX
VIFSDKQKNEIISFTAELIRHPGGSGNERDTADSVRRKMEDLGYDEVFIDEYGSVLGILNGSKPGPNPG